MLDDHSADDTYAILCRLRDQDHRLRVLIGADLPPDWYGKPFACWQLAHAARGEYLLLTDADCVFAPDALLLALGAAAGARRPTSSRWCRTCRCEGFWERLLIPIQYFVIFAFLPTPLIRRTPFPWFAAANGAFLFLTRETYFAVDGHRAVRQQLAEDVKFAQHVKRQGKSLWYGDGSRTYAVRMYHGLDETLGGLLQELVPGLLQEPAADALGGFLAGERVRPAAASGPLWGWRAWGRTGRGCRSASYLVWPPCGSG